MVKEKISLKHLVMSNTIKRFTTIISFEFRIFVFFLPDENKRRKRNRRVLLEFRLLFYIYKTNIAGLIFFFLFRWKPLIYYRIFSIKI